MSYRGVASPKPDRLEPEIDYLVIGHVTRDVVAGDSVAGGTALYASMTARRLGKRVAVVTSAGADLGVAHWLPGVSVSCRVSSATTAFVNEYLPSGRRQTLLARALPVSPEDVPRSWRNAPIVHLGPVADEFGPELVEWFRGAPGVQIVGATLQGWLRRWDDQGVVRRQHLPWPERLLANLDAAILSIEDVDGDWSEVERYAKLARVLVVTTGASGATVYADGECRQVRGFSVSEVDPTGAGDVFAAAYLSRLADGGDPFVAARFANCVASFAVEGPQTSTIPVLADVTARLASGG